MLSEGQKAELEFWKGIYAQYAGQDYAAVQSANLPGKMRHWPDYKDLCGIGLDLGCGPTSVFEGSLLTQQSATMYAVDPLLEHYQQMYTPAHPTVIYKTGYRDGDPLPFCNGFFDYVFCINVIDHTEHHTQMLDEIVRTLKVHGTLFFMVNFDWMLTPPNHASLWNWEVVEKEVSQRLFPERHTIVYEYDYKKYSYWGKFVKAC
jgi:SAM-dependent methyltransferase